MNFDKTGFTKARTKVYIFFIFCAHEQKSEYKHSLSTENESRGLC